MPLRFESFVLMSYDVVPSKNTCGLMPVLKWPKLGAAKENLMARVKLRNMNSFPTSLFVAQNHGVLGYRGSMTCRFPICETYPCSEAYNFEKLDNAGRFEDKSINQELET